jgi:hypothetical protein
MTTSEQVNTGKVSDRRTLHFKTLDEANADAAALVDAERAGKLRQLGNWPLGKNFGHLASWVNYSFDGVPLKVPWLIRKILRLAKNRTLYKPMPAGSKIPKVPGGTIGTDMLSTEEGISRLNKAYDRLKAGTPSLPHLLFGPMTHDEWINQHLRHAELHLSFFRAD